LHGCHDVCFHGIRIGRECRGETGGIDPKEAVLVGANLRGAGCGGTLLAEALDALAFNSLANRPNTPSPSDSMRPTASCPGTRG
jgi:hypothetical protein